MDIICELVKGVKNGDEKAFVCLLEKMSKVINSYANKLYKDDREEVKNSLVFALWKSCMSAKYSDNEGQMITYLNSGIKYAYLEMYRESRKRNDNEVVVDFDRIVSENKKYTSFSGYIEIKLLINQVLKEFPYKKRVIMNEIILGKTDIEVANKLNVSRQYVHRVKLELQQKMKESGIYEI